MLIWNKGHANRP